MHKRVCGLRAKPSCIPGFSKKELDEMPYYGSRQYKAEYTGEMTTFLDVVMYEDGPKGNGTFKTREGQAGGLVVRLKYRFQPPGLSIDRREFSATLVHARRESTWQSLPAERSSSDRPNSRAFLERQIPIHLLRTRGRPYDRHHRDGDDERQRPVELARLASHSQGPESERTGRSSTLFLVGYILSSLLVRHLSPSTLYREPDGSDPCHLLRPRR